MAPEIVGNDKYDNKVDVWSVGIIAFQLLNGTLPFTKPNIEELKKYILNTPI